MTVLLLVTLVSILLAIVMSAIAWRSSREERRRADARVAALAADIEDAVASRKVVGLRSQPARATRPIVATSSDLFTAGDPAGASSRSVVVVGIGLFVFATLAALGVVFSSGSRATAIPPAAANAPAEPARAAAAGAQVPLELVALGQERAGDHLIVRGVIQNPPAGARVDRLIAVAFLFDRDGGFLTSGRAPIETTALPPGGESAFSIDVPGAANVARYRVSFRTESVVIPHVDKRHVS
jgi:hypothetical protein